MSSLKAPPPVRPPVDPTAWTTVRRRPRPPVAAPVDLVPGRPDPRIAARRAAVQRDAGRRRLRRLGWATGVLATVGLAVLATRTPILDLEQVEVLPASGVGALPAELHAEVVDAAAAAGADVGVPLLDVDPTALRAALEAVPGVARAEIGRDWPDTLVLAVTPRIPVAWSGGALVAADGVVVGPAAAPDPGLVVVDGVGPVPEPGRRLEGARAEAALAVAAALPADLRDDVVAVRGRPGGDVELDLAIGGVALLGPPTDLGDKLAALATVLQQVDLRCLATLDVRVASAPAVTRSGPIAEGCGS